MKKIRTKSIVNADKSAVYTKQRSHHVFLGNNITVYFSNLKEAKSFLAKTNLVLNQKLFELNIQGYSGIIGCVR